MSSQEELDKQLWEASKNNLPAEVFRLINEGANIETDYADVAGRGVLAIAVEEYSLDVIKLLISKKINVDKKDWNGKTPFLYACSEGYLKIAQILIKAGCDVTAATNYGNDAVMYASLSGNIQLLELLLNEHKRPLNIVNEEGSTPMHWACSEGRLEMMKFLISKGFSLNSPENENGRTPMDVLKKPVYNTDTIARKEKCLKELQWGDMPEEPSPEVAISTFIQAGSEVVDDDNLLKKENAQLREEVDRLTRKNLELIKKLKEMGVDDIQAD